MSVQGIYETLDKISKLKRTQDKVEALRLNDSFALRIILQGVFDPAVKWLLPPGPAPYNPNVLVDQHHILLREAGKIRYFVEGFYPNLPAAKRESMFIEFLERIDKQDAILLTAAKDKSLPFKGITIDHVKAAFPDLIP